VIVVGGGPAGAMAACTLAPRCRVLLLERARLPRHKLCSGVLTPKSLAQLRPALDVDRLVVGTASETRVCYGAAAIELRHAALPILFASRPRMDAGLVELAGRRGASVHESTRVTGVDPGAAAVLLAGGRRLRARAVIGADGATGPCAAVVHPRRAQAIGLEVHVPDPRGGGRRPALLDTRLSGGYFWAFPKADGSVAVGLASARPALWPRMRALLARWLPQALGTELPARVPGHPIPFLRGAGSRGLRAGRLLLAGDAAALADPLLYEGIPYALWSGRVAAETVLDWLDGRGELAAYERRLAPLAAFQRPQRAVAGFPAPCRRPLLRRAVLDLLWRHAIERIPDGWPGADGRTAAAAARLAR
jgi:geranylgeranyl reductase family protein